MTKKKLDKKVIYTANLGGLTEGDELLKITAYGQAVKDNPTLTTDIDPAATVLLAMTTAINAKFVERTNLMKQLKSLTEGINSQIDDARNIVLDNWLPFVQENHSDNIENGKKLGFGVKGQDNGTAPETKGKATESHPVIIRIDMNVHLQHKLHFVNSETSKPKMPKDAMDIAIYSQIGGVMPNDTANMKYDGPSTDNKFVKKFSADDLGKTVFYIVVYIGRKSKQPQGMSPVYSAVIN